MQCIWICIEICYFLNHWEKKPNLLGFCSSDVYFVLQQPYEPFPLINNTDQTLFPENVQNELKNKIGGDPTLEVITVRRPFDAEASRIFQLSKSYVWWLDDPWAALVALAAISILLCLVGLIVIIFTHSRLVTKQWDNHFCIVNKYHAISVVSTCYIWSFFLIHLLCCKGIWDMYMNMRLTWKLLINPSLWSHQVFSGNMKHRYLFFIFLILFM